MTEKTHLTDELVIMQVKMQPPPSSFLDFLSVLPIPGLTGHNIRSTPFPTHPDFQIPITASIMPRQWYS